MDFLIIYENKARELESDCLLAEVLKKRGYSVKIVNERAAFKTFLNPKVVITPYLYSELDVVHFNTFWKKRKRGIINLQYEQVLNDAALDSGFHIPKDSAKFMHHICWGENTKKRLEKAGITNKYLHITGHMSMDLNRNECKGLYYDKKKLQKEFNIPSDKKWNLFISSFVVDGLSKKEQEIVISKIPSYNEFIKISKISKERILKWFEKLCDQHPEQIFIYRPHPAENITKELEQMAKKYTNFVVISDYSIRQWIAVSDSISTWFSTAIIDAFFAEKKCFILRPIEIPEYFDEKLFKNGDFIDNFEELEKNLLGFSESIKFPIEVETISEYYGKKTENFFVNQVADVCELVLNEELDIVTKYSLSHILRTTLVDFFSALVLLIPSSISLGRFELLHQKMKKNKYKSKRLVRLYSRRFRKLRFNHM